MDQPTRVKITKHDADLLTKQSQRIQTQQATLQLLQGSHQETLETYLRNGDVDPTAVGRCDIKVEGDSAFIVVYPLPQAEKE
jgi:hypothetical protein